MTKHFQVPDSDASRRLDQFLTEALGDVSRSRVQQLIKQGQVQLDGVAVTKPSHILEGGESIAVAGEVELPPLKAEAEDIPLEIVFEDADLAVINKPAGMMVHAGAGVTVEARSKGTMVNALLHHMGKLSKVGGALRPGIVHRLDRETSGLILVAKNDRAHRHLAEQFAQRAVHKKYIALVQGWPKKADDTINKAIARDPARRARMSAKVPGGRAAVTHFRTLERIDSVYGKYSLLEVTIETGRTHQIRVHLASIGHPVVGDVLYGAAPGVKSEHPRLRDPWKKAGPGKRPELELTRNFLHAAELEFTHPTKNRKMRLSAPLPQELQGFLKKLKA
jgi:23S rRNA pseudouridine1911/1915/1917 synthase